MDAAESKVCLESMLIHLIPWAKEHGVEISHKRTSYDPNAGFADITLTVIGEGGCTASEYDLKQYAESDWTKIKPEWIGREIKVRGRQAILFGYKARSHKYPFLVRCGNGDVFKVTETTIVNQLSIKDAESAESVA